MACPASRSRAASAITDTVAGALPAARPQLARDPATGALLQDLTNIDAADVTAGSEDED